MVDLFPDSVREEFRKDLKEYIIERINYYEAGSDEKKIADGFDKNEFDFSKNMGTYCNHSAKKTKL
jgi:hypothetical protein